MERRKHQRRAVTVNLRIEGDGTCCYGIARDISTRGIFVDIDRGRLAETVRDVELHFEIDTGMQVLSRQLGGKIVRNEGDGLAIRFAEHDILCRAVVHELMYYMKVAQEASTFADGCTHDIFHARFGSRIA